MSDSESAATGLVLDRVFEKHDPGPGHPEQIARYRAIAERLESAGLVATLVKIPVSLGDDEVIERIHLPAYVRQVAEEILSGKTVLSTGDTAVCQDSLEVARKAVGAAVTAVDMIMEGRITNAFCALRPPGHHATPSRGMGFCVFNQVAIAARHAQRVHGIERVAIVDWDVHHGNGTQDCFYADPTVHFFSTHQSPLYPGTGAAGETGAGEGQGYTLNCPLPAGSGMAQIGAAFREQWLPAMDRFKPEFILISAGFDSRVNDPLGAFTLTDDDFSALTAMVMDVAATHAQGRVLACLEGGYNVEGLALAVEAHVQTLAGVRPNSR